MATNYGVLAQLAPAATTLSVLWTVPGGKHAHVRVLVANRDSVADTFRLAVSINGAAIADAQYLAYDQEIAANDSVSSVPFEVGSTDVIRVYSTNGNMSFAVTGIEEDD